jgi:hypothetical protein
VSLPWLTVDSSNVLAASLEDGTSEAGPREIEKIIASLEAKGIIVDRPKTPGE